MDEILEMLEDIRPDVDFAQETGLVDDGVFDSMDIIELMSQIESRFGIEIPVDELVPENFNTPDAILALVDKCR